MSRFFVSREAVKGNSISISGEEAHHIIDVMRLKPADKIVCFDGSGKEYAGFIKSISARTVSVEIVRIREAAARGGPRITLIQALPKKERMDYIVEKSTELGVSSLIPVITERTIPVWDASKKSARSERWLKIAKEAAKQCGRTDVPCVDAVINFSECVKNPHYDLALIAALTDETAPMKEALSGFRGGSIAIAIGPEGDFTAAEIEAAKKANFRPISLGPRVLKSDTAGLAALAILNYEFGK